MNARVSKSRFKAQALEILRQVERTGEPVIITDHGRPVVVLRKYAKREPAAQASLAGSILHYEAPFEPLDDGLWEAQG